MILVLMILKKIMNFVKRIEKIKELNDKLDSDNFV